MQVVSLSLAHLGLGLLMILALVGVREVGRGFFTLNGWCAVILVAAGWLLCGRDTGLPWILSGISLLSFAIGWVALRARRRDIAGPFYRSASAIAALAVCAQGWFLARGIASARVPWISGADFLLSAALLGAVTVAMVLGHWYLVQPGLAIEPLARLTRVFLGVLIARTIMEAAMTAGAVTRGGISLVPPAGEVLAFPALILAQRALFGLAGPLVLAPLVHRTVVMRSTMSATGLLYVAVALVWVGEFLSKYLLMPLRLV